MATKEELIGGVELLIREAKRIGGRLTDADWASPGDEGGWTSKEVLAHVAGLGTLVIPFATNMAQAGPDVDTGATMNVNDFNAQLVGARKGKTPKELIDEIETSYGKVIDWARTQPDDFFEKRATFGGYKNMTVGDLAMQAVVMHGISHLYHSAAWVP